jgi:hypothetical protein
MQISLKKKNLNEVVKNIDVVSRDEALFKDVWCLCCS